MGAFQINLKLVLLLSCVSLFGTTDRAYSLSISTTFENFDSQVVGVLGDQALDFAVTNDTGITWLDFHVASIAIGPLDPLSYTGPGSGVFSSADFVLDIFDLNIVDGSTLNFVVDYACGIAEVCALGTVIEFFPTADNGGGAPIPEPASLALFGIGLAGLGFIGWRRRRKAAA